MLMCQVVLHAIQKQMTKNPMATAVCYANRSYSYLDLEMASNQLANYLENYHVVEGDIIAFFMRRSFDVLVTMLGIWKVGASYLSLDFDTPLHRLKQLIFQAKPKCIVSEPSLINSLPQQIPILTRQDPEYLKCSTVYQKQPNIRPDQPAYLIYTSGSTGQSKGVLVTQANLTNYLFWFNEHFQITDRDIFNFNSSPAFDFAVTCTFPPLLVGAQVLITSEVDILNIEEYCNQLIQHQVTFVKWTPSYFKFLVSYVEKSRPNFSNLRYLMVAGEELLTTYVERWFSIYPSHTIINEYGPTETTVGITTQLITKSNLNKQLKTIPIGYPVQNSILYVVDSNNHVVEKGEIGELLVGGSSVSLGYYNEPELTNTSFIKNPFGIENDILYRTGDLVRQLSDESYLYVGRIDHQIKINGYRVEPSEVEYYLLQYITIDQAYVVARKSKENYQFLEGYIVLKPKTQFDEAKIRAYLSQHLFHFMVPRNFYVIDQFPLTSNGKIDHRNLLKPLEVEGYE